jgi:hypothetical protein
MAIASRYEESGGERYGISQARLPLVISGTLPILSKTASNRRIETTREAISGAATDPAQMAARVELAKFTSQRFDEVGTLLHVSGHIVGPDRKSGASPFGHGSDETVAISLLLRIASQLISASTDLFLDGRSYAAAALIRQMVEVEYLAWAFENSGPRCRTLAEERQGRKARIFHPR